MTVMLIGGKEVTIVEKVYFQQTLLLPIWKQNLNSLKNRDGAVCNLMKKSR